MSTVPQFSHKEKRPGAVSRLVLARASDCTRLAFAAWLAAIALAGCGGGSSPETTPVEGAYQGSLSNGSTTLAAIYLLALEHGSFWSLYGAPSDGGLSVTGFTEGKAAVDGGTISAPGGLDFGTNPPGTDVFSGTYTATSISGISLLNGMSINVAGTKFQTSAFDYHARAEIGSIAGNWTLSLTDGTSLSTTINASGAISATSASGCIRHGSIMPRASGKNVFNVDWTSGPAPCTNPNLLTSGIGVVIATGTGQTQLIIATIDAGRTLGIAASGRR